MKKLLFVSHDANRAGAQILLLRFLRLLKNHPDYQFSVLLKEGGIIENEFEALTTTYFWKKETNVGIIRKIANKFFNKNKQDNEAVIKILVEQKFDLVISNTVTNGNLLEALAILKVPMITYVHELEMGIQQYTSPEEFQKTLSFSKSFIACAASVKQNLIENHAIDVIQISVLPSLLPDSALSFKSSEHHKNELKNKYNIPQNAFLIGGMGTVDLRKGVDIFLQTAHKLKQQPDIYFLWVGGQSNEIEYKFFQIDKDRLGLTNVIFQTSITNPLDYIDAFDVFFVSSREDPYPLVVLEAAMLAKPILCFDKAGGAKDFVEHDCGFVTEYLNVDAIVEKIKLLKDNPNLVKNLGDAARSKALERHNQENAFQVFVDILNNSN